jgi:hypothetical protein
MSINEDQLPIPEEKTPSVSPGNYSPVTVILRDTWGAIFLGILSVILLVGWMRAEARNRVLIAQSQRAVAEDLPAAQ